MEEFTEKARKRAALPIAVAAAVAGAFVVLAAALSLLSGGAVVESGAGAPFAFGLSGLLLVGGAALAAWGVSVDYRCANSAIGRVLRVVVIAMIAWLGIALVVTVAQRPPDLLIGAVAVMSDFIIAAAIELCLEMGIIPSVRRYRSLFRHLPLDLKVLNAGGRVVYRTDIARTLDNTTLWRLASQMKGAEPGAVASVRADATPDSVFKLYRLHAGVALLTEDASEINQLQQRLEERREQLTAQNEVLRRNHAMRSLIYRQQRERELGERVERDLASTAAQIRRILDNRITGTGAEIRAERRQQLNLVKVLVAYSKRKGMLALAAAESETLTGEQMELVAREAMADLRSIGIECAILVQSPAPIPIAAFNAVYDSFYDCILAVLPRVNPVLMTFIAARDDVLEMRVAIECAIGLQSETAVEMIPQIATSTEPWTAVQMDIAHDLEGRLAMRGGDYAVTLDDGLVNATVRSAFETAAKPGEGGGR